MSVKEIMIHSRFDRICHWLMVILVSVLLLSGYYIHTPGRLGKIYDMGLNIMIQSIFGFLATGVFSLWMYKKIVTQSYKDVLFRKRDIFDLKGLLKYYLFMENKPPVHGKYNAGQKLVYTSWFFVFIIMSITGLILYSVNFGYILPLQVNVQKIRFYHFIAACYFMGTIPLHIYLSVTEDPAKLQAIFTGWVKDKS